MLNLFFLLLLLSKAEKFGQNFVYTINVLVVLDGFALDPCVQLGKFLIFCYKKTSLFRKIIFLDLC